MKAIRIYISLLIFITIASCRPEELPPDETGNPVFSISAGSIDIKAGESDFYLYTEYKKDTLDVYSFIARFAKLSDCETDCEEELSIEIRDAQQTTGAGGVDIENALTVGNYSYSIKNPVISNDLVVLNLTAQPEGTGPFNYQWTIFSDSIITYNTADVTFTLENNLNISSLDVCLEIISNNNCQIEYCNTIYLNTNTLGCQADFVPDNSPALLSLTANMINGVAPFSYMWSNGSTTQTTTQSHNGTLNATYCVTITDSSGCSDDICKEVAINQGTALMVCSSRFSYEKIVEPGGSDSLQLGTVLIQYTNPDGVEYRSDFLQQSNSSNFAISSVEDYENNENGDKTKKLNVSGNCMLYDENGMTINFPLEGIIAVAYPL